MNIVTKHRNTLLGLISEIPYPQTGNLYNYTEFIDKKGHTWAICTNNSAQEHFNSGPESAFPCPGKSTTIFLNGFPCLVIGKRASSGYLDIREAIKAIRWWLRQRKKDDNKSN